MFGLVVFEYAIGTLTIFLMHPYIQFMKHMDSNQITAVALMAGALVCARSPASAVAIVKEVDAEGPFTSTILGVTVLSDVVVIGLFALTSLVSKVFLQIGQIQNVVSIFIAQIMYSTTFGYILSFALKAIIEALRLDRQNHKGLANANQVSPMVPLAVRKVMALSMLHELYSSWHWDSLIRGNI